jgi:endonuclease/exonuclease/phosphatase family metal-dependent hydrolase
MSPKPLALLLAVALLTPIACTDSPSDSPLAPVEPSASVLDAPGLTVMNQNLYIGANIDLLLSGDFATAFGQLLTSNAGGFGRALQLAMEIAEEAPHLVGLQEVSRFEFLDESGGIVAVMDYLNILQAYLDYLHYIVGATPHTWTAIRNDMTALNGIVVPGQAIINFRDADAILVRDDVELLEEPTLVTYDAHEEYSLGQISFPFYRGYLAVTARAEGHTVRFATTHLEVQRFEETQVAQAQQLIAELEESTVPVVLVGDFNSAANHDVLKIEETPAYKMFRRAGYADLWLRERESVKGYTCCQGPDLTNEVPSLSQRLDLILLRYGNAGFGGQSEMKIVGEEASDRFTVTDDPIVGTVTLWPSDHAGVVATFWPAPGLRKMW